MNLNRVAEMIQEINKDMAELNNKPMAVEYFRVCQRGECVKAVMEEAESTAASSASRARAR